MDVISLSPTAGAGLLQDTGLSQDCSSIVCQYTQNFQLDILLYIFYHQRCNCLTDKHCNSGLNALHYFYAALYLVHPSISGFLLNGHIIT